MHRSILSCTAWGMGMPHSSLKVRANVSPIRVGRGGAGAAALCRIELMRTAHRRAGR